jgi:hypothetical protein
MNEERTGKFLPQVGLKFVIFFSLHLFIMMGISIDDVTLFYLIKYIVNHVKILIRTNN